MDSYMLLKAEIHNWGLIGPGNWTSTEWYIYDDGFYRIDRRYNPDIDVLRSRYNASSVLIRCGGILEIEKLQELQRLISVTPWRDEALNCDACDGVAWTIEAYDENGNITNSSGPLNYIYGQRVLEEISSLMPGKEIPEYSPVLKSMTDGMKIEDFIYVNEDNESEIIIGL